MFETYDKDLPILRDERDHNAFLGFDLRKGTTYDEARKIAEYLNAHIEMVTCTVFKPGLQGS
jgi:hypothetical protein